MSNITLNIDTSNVPAHLRQAPGTASEFDGPGGAVDARAKISIRGKVFRLEEGGVEVAKSTGPLDVILVATAPKISRNFYPEYVQGVSSPAKCWSKNGETPDPRSPDRQAAYCAECPRAQKRVNQGAECRQSIAVAVVMGSDPSNKVMRMSLPAKTMFDPGDASTGQFGFLAFKKRLAASNIAQSGVTMRMSFDMNETAPKVLFSLAGYVDEARFRTLQNLDPAVLRAYVAYGPDGMSGRLEASGVDAGANVVHQDAGAAVASPPTAAASTPEPEPVQQAQQAQQVRQVQTPASEPEQTSFGFGAPAQQETPAATGFEPSQATAAGGNPFAVAGAVTPTMASVDDILDRLG